MARVMQAEEAIIVNVWLNGGTGELKWGGGRSKGALGDHVDCNPKLGFTNQLSVELR